MAVKGPLLKLPPLVCVQTSCVVLPLAVLRSEINRGTMEHCWNLKKETSDLNIFKEAFSAFGFHLQYFWGSDNFDLQNWTYFHGVYNTNDKYLRTTAPLGRYVNNMRCLNPVAWSLCEQMHILVELVDFNISEVYGRISLFFVCLFFKRINQPFILGSKIFFFTYGACPEDNSRELGQQYNN